MPYRISAQVNFARFSDSFFLNTLFNLFYLLLHIIVTVKDTEDKYNNVGSLVNVRNVNKSNG